MNEAVRAVVFSEIHPTLLDAQASREATRALHLFAAEGIALVFCSSRTRAEIERVQRELGMAHPFICENGAALFVPPAYFGAEISYAREVAGYHAIEFGRPYAEVVETLRRTAAKLRIAIVGFSDMSVAEVAAECHLSLLQARLAKLRDYDEPFRVIGSSDARRRLWKGLHASQLSCTDRGRFDHVGAAVDIGVAARLLTHLYQVGRPQVMTLAVGHAVADVALLRGVDVPVTKAGNVYSINAWVERIVHIVRDAVSVTAPRPNLIQR